MGPPLSTWPYSHPSVQDKVALESDKVICDDNAYRKCLLVKFVDNFRVICLNFTFVLIFLQVLLCLSSVGAGPVLLNLDYLQGPVPLARNIRHLPCISRRSGQEGLCMFAIDCLKANGSHLGTCIDRFYFGSCCQIPDKTILPQIIGNNIDDNTIDSANFVHPQTEDKVQSTVTKIPELLTQKTTEKIETTVTEKTVTVTDRTEATVEMKSDELTTIDNKILNDDVKITTASIIETTIKSVESKTSEIPITEIPIKLSTFQTVSDSNSVTDKPQIITTTTTTKPTRKPVRPTYKPRPTYRPTNFTRPQYTTSTLKPRPTRPIATYNTTRKPPYRNPPKRPSTKRPLPSPPRLNITILPQSTSSKPIFTRPSSVSITYINTTAVEDTPTITTSTTTLSTTTTPPTTITTTTPSTTTTSSTTPSTTTTTTTTTPTTTERITETTEVITETSPITEMVTEKVTEISTELVTEKSTEKTTITETPLETTPTEAIKETTAQEVTEQETVKPATEADIPIATTAQITTTSTEFPPFVTWTNTVETVTKTPEKVTEKVTESSEETWSPVTPPEGWVLISSIPPTSESTSTTSTSTTTTTTSTTTSTTTTTEQSTTSTTESPKIETTEALTSIEPETPKTTTTEEPTSIESTQEISEFTVNVTLSPTIPTSTSSMGLTTFSVVTSNNVTEVKNETVGVTTSGTDQDNETSSTTPMSATTEATQTTTEKYNMTNYKDVCGRRLWQAPTGRIVGGAKSAFGQWPWQISLRQYRTSTYLHKCGAALLNENWAITAAHCVEHVPPSELLVRLGEHDLASEDEPYGFAERRVQIVASHPHFDPATFEYDLALLRFYEPVSFQPNILPVCVPDDDDDYVGKTAYVTGWGRLFDEGPLPSVLQEVTVPVINNSACESMYQAAGYNEHIPNIFICAGRRRGGTDSCEGDSGGPMVIQRERDNRFVLGGVISWGIGCAEPNQPGVYTRISEFRDWINQILQF